MQILSPGELRPCLHYIGHPAVLLYLIKAEQSCLIDSGMTAMGPLIRKNLDSHIGGLQNLDLHVLTHSHYDHLGSTTFLKREIPDLKIGAHTAIVKVLARPNAIALMRKLNETVTGGPPGPDQPDMVSVEPFDIDDQYCGGERLELGGITVEVLDTPGHTRDSVTYHIVEAKAIILGEAAGVPDKAGKIMPEFLQSYADYMASLEKLAGLDLDFICLPHNYVLAGSEAKSYIKKSIATSIQFKDRLLNELDAASGEQDVAFASLFKKIYKPGGQPKDAFSINLKAMLKAVAREFK